MPRYALRNVSVIDATLLDGLALQVNTIRAGTDEETSWERWERLNCFALNSALRCLVLEINLGGAKVFKPLCPHLFVGY